MLMRYILGLKGISSTYGHSQLKTGHLVRSAIHKQLNGRLVLRWVTTWESLLLYVLVSFFFDLLTLKNTTPPPYRFMTLMSANTTNHGSTGCALFI
ncbi:hypothetical protein KCU78_g10617, partial [Aureobasidium melanogenum]